MRVLHTITGIRNRDGGPFRSVPSLARAQHRLGARVEISAIEADESLEAFLAGGVTLKRFPRSFPQLAGCSHRMQRHVESTPAEVVHHHGLWHRTLHYAHQKARRESVPLIIAPRGMMMPWAWSHHRRRKALAEKIFHPGALAAVDGWHATSEEEAEAIRGLGFRQPICVAPNGVDFPEPGSESLARDHWLAREPSLEGKRVALFYGRFHAKKRIIECIDMWHRIAPPEWTLLLVGIPDQFTVEEVRQYVLNSGKNGHVKVFDGIHHPPPFAVAELFLLTSHSENFGMAVAESLASGVPALVTHGAPWAGLNTADAGWWVDWNNYPQMLRRVLKESPESLAAQGARGRKWMERDYSWSRSAERLLGFYKGLRPQFV